MERVLILCTGNSARSQMAEGLLRHLGDFEVESAGTRPGRVRPEAIAALREIGIDISTHRSKHVNEFDGQRFDTVITVCDNARESCPVFPAGTRRIHWSFEDPAAVEGPEEIRLAAFRRIRDEISERLKKFADAAAVTLRPATFEDEPAVARLLEDSKLVAIDENAQFGPQYVVAARPDGSLAGVAGVEIYGDQGLLRSVAVDPSVRSLGLGRRLVDDRIAWARKHGLRTLYLLTDTAVEYWSRLGFRRVDRSSAPADVAESHEWRSACPASAVSMRLDL